MKKEKISLKTKKYEVPEIHPLEAAGSPNSAMADGLCANGSGVVGTCQNGNSASTTCHAGASHV